MPGIILISTLNVLPHLILASTLCAIILPYNWGSWEVDLQLAWGRSYKTQSHSGRSYLGRNVARDLQEALMSHWSVRVLWRRQQVLGKGEPSGNTVLTRVSFFDDSSSIISMGLGIYYKKIVRFRYVKNRVHMSLIMGWSQYFEK